LVVEEAMICRINLLGIMLLALGLNSARAVEIKVLYGGALRSTFEELIPQFEQATGDKVSATAGPGGALLLRVQNGEAVDLVILTDTQITDLVKAGKVVDGSQQQNIARAGMGVAVQKGATKPDISTVEAFNRTLLNAKTIGHADPANGAVSAIHATQLLSRLEIAPQIKDKIKSVSPLDHFLGAIGSGDVEIGLGLITEIVADPRIDLVGPLPGSLQTYFDFSAGIAATSQQPDAAKALLSFLTSPSSRALIKQKGFE
jgi:molybdate transport system substrate-binding protein